MRRYLIYMLFPVLALSCDRPEGGTADDAPVRFSMETRGASGYTTFSIIAYNKSTGADNYGYRTSGTYYWDNDPGHMLVPGTVEGVEDNGAAIHGAFGIAYISCVSPMTAVNPDGSVPMIPASGKFLCTPVEEANINGYGTVWLRNELIDTRSRLQFRFYKKRAADVMDIDAGAVFVKGVGDDDTAVNFYPATRQARYTSETVGRKCDLNQETSQEPEAADSDKGVLVYTSTPIYVPAAIYAPKDEVEATLGAGGDAVHNGTYLTLNFLMKQNTSVKEKNVAVTLTATENGVKELYPMCLYVYNVILESVYVSVSVSIYEYSEGYYGWEDVPNDGAVEPIVKDWPVGRWKIGADGGWESVEWTTEDIRG